MDCGPLNLAHFHGRRADKFIRYHRYEDAQKALKTSMLYLQDAYKACTLPESKQVLNTHKWEYERKLHQIQLCKKQHEQMKLQEIIPLSEANSLLSRTDNSVSAQSVAKSIDKTVRDFDAKYASTMMEQNMQNLKLTKENYDPRLDLYRVQRNSAGQLQVLQQRHEQKQHQQQFNDRDSYEDDEDMPSLVPLELPTFNFDFNDFSASSSSLTSITSLASSMQK